MSYLFMIQIQLGIKCKRLTSKLIQWEKIKMFPLLHHDKRINYVIAEELSQ